MLIAVRHGSTAHNSDDEGSEKVRSWLPIPLTLEGMKEATDTAELLAPVEDVYALYTSDIVRAVQCAQEIGRILNKEIEPREELRDWNTGNFAGQSVMGTLDKIHGFIDDPNKKVPGGESFQTFLDRCVPFLHEIVESSDVCIAVTHNRVTTLIKALSINKGEYPDTATLKRKGPIEPGGLLIIRSNWQISFQT